MKTKTPLLPLLIGAFLSTAAVPAMSQTLVLGAGFADFAYGESDDQGLINLDYQHKPFHERTRFRAGFGASLSVHFNGDAYLGAGVYGIYDLNERWFVEGSVMPGIFLESEENNDLGGDFQIRSLLGVGSRFDSGNSLSLAVSHKSNASTESFNPGVDALLLRFHHPF